jgi:hypothetical protein
LELESESGQFTYGVGKEEGEFLAENRKGEQRPDKKLKRRVKPQTCQ